MAIDDFHEFSAKVRRQEFFKPKASITLEGWPLEFDWLEDHTFDAGGAVAMSLYRHVSWTQAKNHGN